MSWCRSSGLWTMTEADGSSLNKHWFELQLTLYNIHSAVIWRRWHNHQKLWSGQSLATEYTWRLKSWIFFPLLRSNEATQKGSTKTRFTNFKIPIIWETLETIPRTWTSNVSLMSNFTPGMSRLGPAQMETPDKTKAPWEGSHCWIYNPLKS